MVFRTPRCRHDMNAAAVPRMVWTPQHTPNMGTWASLGHDPALVFGVANRFLDMFVGMLSHDFLRCRFSSLPLYSFDGVYYIMAGACIDQRAETRREPEVWKLGGRRQDMVARESLRLPPGLTTACKRRQIASARASLRLLAAPDAQRSAASAVREMKKLETAGAHRRNPAP